MSRNRCAKLNHACLAGLGMRDHRRPHDLHDQPPRRQPARVGAELATARLGDARIGRLEGLHPALGHLLQTIDERVQRARTVEAAAIANATIDEAPAQALVDRGVDPARVGEHGLAARGRRRRAREPQVARIDVEIGELAVQRDAHAGRQLGGRVDVAADMRARRAAAEVAHGGLARGRSQPRQIRGVERTEAAKEQRAVLQLQRVQPRERVGDEARQIGRRRPPTRLNQQRQRARSDRLLGDLDRAACGIGFCRQRCVRRRRKEPGFHSIR